MEEFFYFALNALFVITTFLFSCRKKALLERLISKVMTSKHWKQDIAIHILFNILRSKGNQTVEFGQLIKRNTRNIFLKNHPQNRVEKLFLNPLLKNEN